MDFFGSDEDEEKEEVTLGLSESSSNEKSDDSTNIKDMGLNEDGDTDNRLQDEVSKLDTVNDTVKDKSHDKNGTSLEEIEKQNQKIMKKLDTVLSRI